ncbi:MAG: sirohydrochlorin cobaltochelatase [Selenomonadaceae bacterium]|nr:sirohydrochlorin cobaltochelatase [Selenomonadaceae bacterium]
MRKAIILASFGSADDSIREKIFGKLATELQKNFPTFEVIQAFTSNFMIRKLERRNIFVPTVDAAILKLRADGFRKIFVLPTHLTAGEEFDNKIKICAADDVEIVSPLLTNDCATPFDKKVFATILECYPRADDEILILIGHGSPNRHNPVYENFQRLSDEILIGVIESTDTPNFDDVVAKLPASGKILLAPMLFNGGVHLSKDISDTWKNRLIALGYEVRVSTNGLGAFEKFRALYIEKLREVIDFGRTQA